MNDNSTKDIERKKINQLAREYSKRGYQVYADAPGYELPYPIENTRPDMILIKEGKIIVVEVKSSETIKKNRDVIALAEYAQRTPGVRFDIVVTNPKPLSSVQSKNQALQNEINTLKKSLLENIETLIDNKVYGPAVMLISTLLEGLLIRVAYKKGLQVPHTQGLQGIAKFLASDDIISKSAESFIIEVAVLRNQVVHTNAQPSLEQTKDMNNRLRILLEEW